MHLCLLKWDSLLLAIADWLGHESVEITYQYAHLFPSKELEIANKLELERTSEREV